MTQTNVHVDYTQHNFDMYMTATLSSSGQLKLGPLQLQTNSSPGVQASIQWVSRLVVGIKKKKFRYWSRSRHVLQ